MWCIVHAAGAGIAAEEPVPATSTPVVQNAETVAMEIVSAMNWSAALTAMATVQATAAVMIEVAACGAMEIVWEIAAVTLMLAVQAATGTARDTAAVIRATAALDVMDTA